MVESPKRCIFVEIGCESVAPMGLNNGVRDALDTGVPRFALHRLPMLCSALWASSMAVAIEASSMAQPGCSRTGDYKKDHLRVFVACKDSFAGLGSTFSRSDLGTTDR